MLICNNPDKNLSGAGVMHVTKTAAEKQQVKETAEKIKTMTIASGSKPIIAQLFCGEIVLNELN